MRADYTKAMQIELLYEGGKDDDPVDPGGRTNQGIIQREFSSYLIKKGQPSRDVFTMTNSERDEIYKIQYADRVKFDDLPAGIDLVMLDGAINSGPVQSVKWVQRALGLTADGILGLVTMQRIAMHPDYDLLIASILDRRREFLKALKTYWHFGEGWMHRVDNLQKIAQSWAVGSVGPSPVVHPLAHKKAIIVDAKPMPPTAPADATAAGGLVSTILTTIQQTLSPLQGTSAVVNQIILGLLVASSICTVFGIVYGYYARNKRTKLQDVLDLTASPAPSNNDNIPTEVLAQYNDPRAQGAETGNSIVGVKT